MNIIIYIMHYNLCYAYTCTMWRTRICCFILYFELVLDDMLYYIILLLIDENQFSFTPSFGFIAKYWLAKENPGRILPQMIYCAFENAKKSKAAYLTVGTNIIISRVKIIFATAVCGIRKTKGQNMIVISSKIFRQNYCSCIVL